MPGKEFWRINITHYDLYEWKFVTILFKNEKTKMSVISVFVSPWVGYEQIYHSRAHLNIAKNSSAKVVPSND